MYLHTVLLHLYFLRSTVFVTRLTLTSCVVHLQNKELQIKKQYNDTVRIQTRQYKALQKQMIASLPKERRREILKQSKEEQLRKTHMLTLQYEKTIADMSQHEAVSSYSWYMISRCTCTSTVCICVCV